MNEAWPLVIGVLIAIIGSGVGLAALLKVGAENSDTVAEGASKVVKMMSERLDETEARLDALEEYAYRFDAWADHLVRLFDRAIEALPDSMREGFRAEAQKARDARPPRPQR